MRPDLDPFLDRDGTRRWWRLADDGRHAIFLPDIAFVREPERGSVIEVLDHDGVSRYFRAYPTAAQKDRRQPTRVERLQPGDKGRPATSRSTSSW